MLLIKLVASTHTEGRKFYQPDKRDWQDVVLTVAQPFGLFVFAFHDQALHDVLVIIVEW
jgi:hypothetical protein